MCRQIGPRELHEFGMPQDDLQTRKIVDQGVENPKPVLPVVDFDALQRSQAVIGFDEFGRRPRAYRGRRSIAAACANPARADS